MQFLDQVIDVNKYPLPQIEEEAKKTRRIGLGVMGFAELLVQLCIPYNSEEAINVADEVMGYIRSTAIDASYKLAQERGVYPIWQGSIWNRNNMEVRNSTLLTCAPTGTVSMFAAKPTMPCSGGIEPKFALAFTRNQAGSIMLDIDGQFLQIAKQEGWYSEELMNKIAETGSCQNCTEVPEKWRKVFVIAQEIEPEWHVKIQAAFQKHVCSSVSKTINFANTATKEDVDKAYRMAWDLGLKGITVYRDGSRAEQVLSTGTTNNESKKPESVQLKAECLLRPRLMEFNSRGFVVPTYFGKMTLDVHIDENNEPYEVMVNVGSVGSDLMADAVGMGMLVSRILRMNSLMTTEQKVEMVIDTLKNIGGSTSYGFGENKVTSLASAIAKGLQRFMDWKNGNNQNKIEQTDEQHQQQQKHELCPECGNYTLISSEGCNHCIGCGYSACK